MCHKRSVHGGDVYEHEETSWDCAVPAGRAGFAERSGTVSAEPVSGPGHHPAGTAEFHSRAAGAVHREEAHADGGAAVRADWKAFADRNTDGAATEEAGGGGE